MVKRTLISVISIGTVLILIQLFFLIGALTGHFPEEWRWHALVYFVLTLGVFGWATASTEKIENWYFRTSFLAVLPRFLLFATLTILFFFILGRIIQPEIAREIRNVLNVAWYVILFHALIVSFDENSVFQVFFPALWKGRLSRNAIYILSSSLFALFHYWMAGRSLILLLPYFLLGMLFLKIRYKYGIVASFGVHFGYNLSILAFII